MDWLYPEFSVKRDGDDVVHHPNDKTLTKRIDEIQMYWERHQELVTWAGKRDAFSRMIFIALAILHLY